MKANETDMQSTEQKMREYILEYQKQVKALKAEIKHLKEDE